MFVHNDKSIIFGQVKTLIGKLSSKEGTSKAHHGTFDEEDVRKMRRKVNWSHREPFHVIPTVYRYACFVVAECPTSEQDTQIYNGICVQRNAVASGRRRNKRNGVVL